MLYNPEWTKADPLDIKTLIAWLEKQPADKSYNYQDCRGCVLAQYFRAHGFEFAMVDSKRVWSPRRTVNLPVGWNWNAVIGERTMGAALERFRTLDK